LALVGQYGDLPVEGSMDRSCMAGVGSIDLRILSFPRPLVCTAFLDTPPTAKGRVRGRLDCQDRTSFLLTLRNLGPERGIALGLAPDSSTLLVLMYDSSREKAALGLPDILSDMDRALGIRASPLSGEE
jgi:hypothetical protein